MIPYLHNAFFKVNNFLESLPSFWIMRSQRSRRRDKGLCWWRGGRFVERVGEVEGVVGMCGDWREV